MNGVKTCPNGHQMDPSWKVCPYCRTDVPPPPPAAAMAQTVREVAPGVPEAPEPRKTMRLSQVRAPVVGWLVDLDGKQKGQDFRIEEGRVLLGASPDCQIQLDNDFASDQHASLRYSDGQYVLTDLDSTNGTRVNGAPITKRTLADGDRIQIGSTSYIFKGLFMEVDS